MKEVQEDRNMGRTTTDGAMQRELAGAEDGAAGKEVVDACNCGWVFGLGPDVRWGDGVSGQVEEVSY